MKCQTCGSENISIAIYCSDCGAKLREDGGIKVNISSEQLGSQSTNTKAPKAKRPRKKGFLWGLFRIFIILLIMWGVIIVFNQGIKRYKEYTLAKSISGGFNIKSAWDYKDTWQRTMSDIEGLTVWDKYKRGLAVNDGSDSDGDGLTDKEEIEVYKSDPLKVSTAGDLYSDGYKIEKGMNTNEYYEFEGELIYKYNECPEIMLEAVIPTDFNAVVINHTGEGALSGYDVLAQYEVYNYAGTVSIDIQSILKKNAVTIDDVSVYVSNGGKLEKYGFTVDGEIISLKKKLDPHSDYDIYIIKKDFVNDIAITFGIASAKTRLNEDDVKGEGFISCSPLLSTFFGKPVRIYYQQFLNDEKTTVLRNKVLNHAKGYLGGDEAKYYPENSVIGTNALEIKMRYTILNELIPFFDVTYTDSEELGLLNSFYMYYSYADKVAYENSGSESREIGEKRKVSTSGFDIERDELPFGNFKTEIAPEGNCAGISHLTSYLYNTGSYDKSGSYFREGKETSWNIAIDSENRTLWDKGLFDYKTDTFVLDHSMDGITLNGDLSNGEIEFVKMIEANCMKGNDYVNMLYQTAYGGQNGQTEFDYELVEEMKARLESKKILDVYMRMNDGSGHAVNVYGYEKDMTDSNVIWFNVYDSNFPMEKTGDNTESQSGFRLKITKKQKLAGTGYRFDFEYYPIENRSYGASSNTNVTRSPLFIVMDENWNDINPAARYEGDVKRFDFYYVSTSAKEESEVRKDGTADHTASVVYRDSYFANPSCGKKPNDGYNASLATCSLSFAMSAFGSNDWGDAGERDYSIKYKNVEGFLQLAGFNEFGCNDWYTQKPQSDSIGVAVANKSLTVKENDEVKNYTLIAVAVRGGGYESEWAGNFTIGEDGQHYGFSRAKEQVIEYIQKYIQENGITGDIKLWIVGYSRAAATANLVAGAIDEGVSLGDSVRLTRENMYAYCFEPPMGALKSEIKDFSDYYNIYCIINKNDPVTKVAMADLGFTTYGVQLFLPSSVSDGTNYKDKQEAMLKYYKGLDSYEDIKRDLKKKNEDAYPVDDFQMKKVNIAMMAEYAAANVAIPTTIGKLAGSTFVTWINKKFDYYPIQNDVENKWTQAAFLDSMISAITVENVKSRKNYVDNYQNLIRIVFTAKYGTLFPNEPVERCEKFFDALAEKMGSDDFWAELAVSVLAPKLTGKSAENVVENAIAESLNEVGMNYYSLDVIKDFGTAITELVVPFISSHPNYAVTVYCNLQKLGAAHYPELCLAWLRSQDPEYTSHAYSFDWSGSYRIVKVNCPVNVVVYDEYGNVVAKIESDKVRDIKESAIVASVDEDGTKIVYLPSNSAYSVEIVATDNGFVNLSVSEFSGDEDRIAKAELYENISIEKKDSISIEVPAFSEGAISNPPSSGSSVKYLVKDQSGREIDATCTYKGDDVYNHMYFINVEADDSARGSVIGAGIRSEGDFAIISACGYEGYHFVGWYEDGALVSEEHEYRVKVNKDATYIARFEEGNEPFELRNIKYFMGLYWMLIIPVVLLIMVGTLVVIKWRRK